jgi:hypothetical protein
MGHPDSPTAEAMGHPDSPTAEAMGHPDSPTAEAMGHPDSPTAEAMGHPAKRRFSDNRLSADEVSPRKFIVPCRTRFGYHRTINDCHGC